MWYNVPRSYILFSWNVPNSHSFQKTDETSERKKTFTVNPPKYNLLEIINNVQDVTSKNACISDRGASSHFSCNKDIFTTFETVSSTKMLLAVDC